MASAFTRLFTKKGKQGKDDSPQSDLHKPRASLRRTKHRDSVIPASELSYTDGRKAYDDQTFPSHEGEKGVWRASKSPYSVVTEPKTSKSAKSCPVATYPSYQPRGIMETSNDSSSARGRFPSASQSFFAASSRRYPMIPESSDFYEYENFNLSRIPCSNLTNGGDSGRLDRRRGGGGSLIDYRHRGSRSNAQRRIVFDHHHAAEFDNSRQKGTKNSSTSEYGSADPSPTDLLYRKGFTLDPASVEQSDDYDSCDSDELPSDLLQVCAFC